jgi:hypothetical protein
MKETKRMTEKDQTQDSPQRGSKEAGNRDTLHHETNLVEP